MTNKMQFFELNNWRKIFSFKRPKLLLIAQKTLVKKVKINNCKKISI